MRVSNINIPRPILLKNGVAERKNRTLIEMARTMLDEYKYPYKLWAEAINTACHASNRLYLCKLKNKTPYDLLIRKKPNVKYFRVFGCKCFILNKKTRLAKFEAKTYEGIFFGYASNSHAYRVLNKDRKSTRLNSSHVALSRMPSSAS